MSIHIPIHPVLYTLTINDDAPIGMQSLPAHKSTLLGCEEYITRRNFARLSHSIHRRPVPQSVTLLNLLAPTCGQERCPHRPGSNCVDTNTLLDQLIGECTSEGNHGALARRIVQSAGDADVGVHRRTIDNHAAFGQMWQHILGKMEVRVQIDAKSGRPLLPMVTTFVIMNMSV